MRRKKNPDYLAKLQAKKAAEQAARTFVDTQMALDAAVIAANNTFHRKGEIIIEFVNEFNKVYHEMSLILMEDAKSDEELSYTKEKVDAKLKYIFGEGNVLPWNERYDFTR